MKKILLLAGIAGLASFYLSARKPEEPIRPNFIFILTDDQGWTSVSAAMDNRHPDFKSNYYETPNIDRLGKEGMRFSRGYAPAALCTPSRRSIQFGQSPIHTGDATFAERYDPRKQKWITIPSLLKSVDAGYKTAHYGKWDLRAGIFPEDLGYDESDGDTGNNNGDLMTDSKTKWEQVHLTKDPKRTGTVTARALSFMQRQNRSGHPFYLQVSYYAPHVDIQAKEKTYEKYQRKKPGSIHDNPGWAAMLEDMDDGVGRILNMVEDLGIADNTYIIFLSDNGGVPSLPPPSTKHKLDMPSGKKTNNYPLRGGKWVLYEGGIRVPFIIKGPGIQPGSFCHKPVLGYDLLPTIGELAGNRTTLPDYLDGSSIKPLLADPAQGTVHRKDNDLFFHRYEKSYEHTTIIEGKYKLLKFWRTGKVELYDLENDLEEIHDLAKKQPEKTAALERKLMRHLEQQGAEVLGARRSFPGDYPALHPRYRQWPSPAADVLITDVPPALSWPVIGKNARYDVRLSKNEQFPLSQTIHAENIPWTIFNPHRALASGRWYWQYRVHNGEWSSVNTFRMPEKMQYSPSPSVEKLLSSIPAHHPRLLIGKNEELEFARQAAGSDDAAAIIKEADELLGDIPDSAPTLQRTGKKTGDYEDSKIKNSESKALGFRAMNHLSAYSQAYLLTRRQKYANKALQWAKAIARWDPEGATSVSDFGDAGCMLAMALAYDTFYGQLSGEDKKALLENIRVRASRFYKNWINDVDAKVLSAHVWQYDLHFFIQTALATFGDLKEARDWLTYSYELWTSRAPILGGTEGGWLEGAHYFMINVEALLGIPMIIRDYTGFDFIRNHPWYTGNPYWMLYSFPAGSFSDGFGDNVETNPSPGKDYLAYADALAKLTGSRAAATYAQKIEQTENITLADADMFRWLRLRYLLNVQRPPVLPDSAFTPARLFSDIGVADMHSNIGNTAKNLMVSMRASPYGGYGHMLADQNTFNILYGGKPLFYMSGHKVAMSDKHRLEWYKATIGHNGVLIDGKGQGFDSESYGWIPRFVNGRQLSYAAGDASVAYNGNSGKEKTGLKKFRRHLLLLHPDVVVVYDELEADHPASWSWYIHSPQQIVVDSARQYFHCALNDVSACAAFFSSQPVQWALADTFAVEAENWMERRDANGKLISYGNNQWHLNAATVGKTGKARFLAVMRIREGKQAFPCSINEKQEIVVGGWTLKAELNTSKPAMIRASRNDGKTFFSSGSDVTLLRENIHGKWVQTETADKTPEIVQQIPAPVKKR
ncbi:DUF4962 domain-containing protein [Chitinophaga sp. GCM10012297]|uniref:DUF4962 domain-containing protein n=1 Tax=Chitinophaga chungangae TaxID=2821488 RepID=A0ABS3YFL3_9BACT|nr:DUF4962 domain-containing protein [Chitinophaga chungangae]MBO9153476.1 DUF4962 domain-containing protein [Chitinophaga chungangae]